MVNSISAEIIARRALKPATGAETAFLVFDTESVPDGELLKRVKYPDEDLTAEEAIQRAQAEVREQSKDGSDFLPVTFQLPITVCVLRVGADFGLQAITCMGAPQFQTEDLAKKFWQGVAYYKRAKLVTFNGRGFDLPLMEMAAYQFGCSARDYFYNSRNRYNGNHIDLCDWLSNYGACRLSGGLNMLAKKRKPAIPGKMGITGAQVYALYQSGRHREINDYCMFDTLDTYFVFLRTRVLLGEIPLEEETALVRRARSWLTTRALELPALHQYLEHWHAEL
jgi:predicted PolB exonuclease-like 3'-5' exonuclease